MTPIGTALLSFGMSGRVFHAPFIEAHPGFELLGSWERSTRTIRDHYPAARSYDSLDAVLDDPAVELVVVNTPTLTHVELTRAALEYGKHVVVEKAFTGTAAEAVELRALARQQGRKLAVFQNRRWDSDFLSVREVLDSGRLGDIVEASLGYLRFDPNLSPKAHKEEPSAGSGIVKDLGPHVIDQALVMFGMPDAVFADIGITREGSKVDDYFDILLRYRDKRVHVKGGYFFKQPPPEYALFGTRGSFLKARSDVQEAQLQQGMSPSAEAYGKEAAEAAGVLCLQEPNGDRVERIDAPTGCYAAFYEGVYDSLVNDSDEPVTATDGLRVMQIIDAARQSADEGKLVAPGADRD